LSDDVKFEAIPLNPDPRRAHIIEKIMVSLCEFDTIFTDYQKGPDRLWAVAQVLNKPNSRTWEVWRYEEGIPIDVVGILYLTDVVWGQDAVAHFVFFDKRLHSKTQLIAQMLDWVFEDHERWRALQRVTVTIPDFMFALVRYTQRYLGFSGPFTHKIAGKSARVEGVKRNAILWRGKPRDLLILGKLNATRT
jgi:hypothetical protein